MWLITQSFCGTRQNGTALRTTGRWDFSTLLLYSPIYTHLAHARSGFIKRRIREQSFYQGSLTQLPKLNKVLEREFLPAAASSAILSLERMKYRFLPSTGKFLRNSLPTTNSPLISCMSFIFPGLPYLARLD